MLTILWIVLGVLLTALALVVIVVLCVNARVQQLKGDQYSNTERFNFIRGLFHGRSHLFFAFELKQRGLKS